MSETPLTYSQTGVDIAKGDALVQRIAPLAARTRGAGAMDAIGGFGGLFDLRALGMRDPILVAATDGVGSKLEIAQQMHAYRSIGQDLVAMCVNDLLCQNATPLFFLDYLAVHKLDVDQATELIDGIASACQVANCQLIGGETAEMPSIYPRGKFDLAGFAVGAVERDARLPTGKVRAGARVLGIASSGLHANGYALAQAVLPRAGLSLSDELPTSTRTVGEVLLEPTHIYTSAALAASQYVEAYAHITGAGLLANVMRVLPAGLGLDLDLSSVPAPLFADYAIGTGAVSALEAYRVWNMGVGLVAIVASEAAAARVRAAFSGFACYELGVVIDQPEQRLRDSKFQL